MGRGMQVKSSENGIKGGQQLTKSIKSSQSLRKPFLLPKGPLIQPLIRKAIHSLQLFNEPYETGKKKYVRYINQKLDVA